MSPFVRSTYLSIISCTIIFSVYAIWVFHFLGVGYFTGPDAMIRVGKSIGVLIVAGFGFEIALQLAGIFFGARGGTLAGLIVDERDKQIAYRSVFISMFFICGGIFLAVAAMAMGWEIFWVFNIMVLFYALGVAAELGSKLYFLREGISIG